MVFNIFSLTFGCGINSKVYDTSFEEELGDTAPSDLEDSVEETAEPQIEETAEPVSEPSLSDHEYDGGIDYEDIDLTLLELDIQDLFDNFYQYHAFNYIEAYATIIDQWGGDCPEPYDYGYMVRYFAPSGGCTTDTGMLFLGMMDVYRNDDEDITSLRKQAFAFFNDGTELFLGGSGITRGYNDGSSGDRQTWSSTLSGDYFNTHATQYPWMAKQHGAGLSLNQAEYHNGAQYFTFRGRVEVEHGIISDFSTDLLAWKSNAPCLIELANNFWLRLEDGRWLELRFDMISNQYGDGLESTGTCDGCINVYQNDIELGEVCIDTSSLMWEVGGAPWPW